MAKMQCSDSEIIANRTLSLNSNSYDIKRHYLNVKCLFKREMLIKQFKNT